MQKRAQLRRLTRISESIFMQEILLDF